MRIAILRATLLISTLLLAGCGNEAAKTSADSGAAKSENLIKPTDMIDGDPNAPVTLIEYASTTCPHCAVFAEQIIPEVKEKYIDTGKVKLVFRAFPTPPVTYALIGSVLARCAAEKSGPDAYFLVTNALFRTQHQWIGENAKPELAKIVAQAGMDETELDACLQRKDFIDLINENAKEATEKYDVQGTPAFILNGKKMEYKSKEDFEKLIEDAIAAAGA
ncbi:MAG: DsbA family protein [Parvularculaceae bacterium]